MDCICGKELKIISIYNYHDIYECEGCEKWVVTKLETCCRKPFEVIAKRDLEYPRYLLYYQCLNCGGSLNQTKPLKPALFQNEKWFPFDSENFNNWKSQKQQENKDIYEIVKHKSYLNSNLYKYQVYLNSSKWKEKRSKVLERDLYLCQKCKSAKAEEVHHITYDSIYEELLDDLISLCALCHKKEHNQIPYK